MTQYKNKKGELFNARPVDVKKDANGEYPKLHQREAYESVELAGGACDVPFGHMIVTPLGKDGQPCGLPTAPSDAAFAEQYDAVAQTSAKPALPPTAKAEGNS